MKPLKKTLLFIALSSILRIENFGVIYASDQPTPPGASTEFTTYGMPTQNSTYLIGGRQISAEGSNDLLNNAIKLVNRIMSMLSVVALVILLIGGFKMITANGDEGKFKKGLTTLKQAAIGLVIIGLSWAIIRLIFRFIKKSDDTSTGYNDPAA